MRTRKEDRMGNLPKPNSVIELRTSLDTDFFRLWCVFLRPVLNLTDRETDVVACFLKHRFELEKSISDQGILDEVLMGNATKRKVMEELHMTQAHLYVILSNLKKKRILNGNSLHPRLIPTIRKDDKSGYYQLLILFRL